MVFVLITLLGVSYVGARYARLDRLVFDDSYTVVAHLPDSGGVFAGGEVSYRGVRVGQVGGWQLTDRGRRRLPRRRASPTTRSRPTPWRWSATARRSASSTSSCSRRWTPSPTCGGLARSRRRTPARRSRPRSCSRHISNTVESVDRPALKTTVERARQGVQRHRTGPAADHRHRQRLHQLGQRQLRLDPALITRQQHGAASGQIDSRQRDPDLRPGHVALQRHLAGSDEDLRAVIETGRPRPTSCAPSSRTTRSTSAS